MIIITIRSVDVRRANLSSRPRAPPTAVVVVVVVVAAAAAADVRRDSVCRAPDEVFRDADRLRQPRGKSHRPADVRQREKQRNVAQDAHGW